jgi:hypothetical protein
MIIGSEGTLAVITRARLKVRPLPASRWLRGYRVADVPTALRLMRRLMQGELWPSVVRLYDPVDTLIGGRTQPKRAGHGAPAWWRRWLKAIDALPAVRRRTLALPLALPGLLQSLADRWAQGCLVIVGWEGDPEVVRVASEAGHAILMSEAEDLGPEPGERWFASRHAVSYKLMPVFERGGFADTMEIAARWSVLPRAYEAVREAVRGHALIMAHMSHVYPEGGCIYFSFAGRGDPAVYERVWRAAQGAALAAGATVTHHHGVGIMKAPWATAEVGAAVRGWVEAKNKLDPASLLNPGRLFLTGEGDEVPEGPALFAPPPEPEDGLCAPTVDGGATRWATLGGVPVWAREAWHTGVVEVEATVDGRRVWLGRGPRSAAGPDLRGWVAEQGEGVVARVASDATGEASPTTWMGVGRPEDPWGVAQALLRGDLRPAVCEVVDDALRVGFRGPAARAFGALAAARVPGGLEEVPFEARPRPRADLRPALGGGPVEAVTSHHRLARVPWPDAPSSAAREGT